MKNPLRFLILWLVIFAATLVAWSVLPAGARAGAAHLATVADIPDRAAGPERWKRDLHEADRQLRSGRWSDALASSSAVLRSMQNHLQGGEGAGRFLATAELFKAVAEEGLERPEDAYWDWLTAWNLDAEVAQADLAAYGAVVAGLRERATAELAKLTKAQRDWRDKAPTPIERADDDVDRSPEASRVTKPEKVRTMPPTYPEAERHACRAGKVVLDSIIDRTGKISAFHVQQSMNPQFDLAALEAVRLWRFTPARLDGKPVAVYYTLTVNFQIDHPCTPRG